MFGEEAVSGGESEGRVELEDREREKSVNWEEVFAELEKLAAPGSVEFMQPERWDGMS